MSKQATIINLTDNEKETLKKWVRASKIEYRLKFRAKIILLANEGKGTREIARILKTTPAMVSSWRVRFASKGIDGLKDAPHPGRKRKYTDETDARIVNKLSEPVPYGRSMWTAELISESLGDVSKYQVWRVLKKLKIRLRRKQSWCVSCDPEFAYKAADIVGLYLNPPENAVVFSIDEKPCIQAKERVSGWLKLKDGKIIRGYSSEYRRHGTSTLITALEIETGKIKAGHYESHKRSDFTDFMNSIVSAYPDDMALHVILDNFVTHKPKNDERLEKHPNVHFHFTPTHASWLNQIELWFSILTRQALRGASFTSVKHLREVIDRFIDSYNEKAKPFIWTKDFIHPVYL